MALPRQPRRGCPGSDPRDGGRAQGAGRVRHGQRQLQAGGDKKEIAQYHVDRVPLLRAVVKVAKSPEDH